MRRFPHHPLERGRVGRLAAILSLFVAALPPQASESDGRWSWDANLGIQQRRISNTVGGASAVDYDQMDLRLSAGLNGYIVHPLIARFRVDTDLYFGNISSGSGSGTSTFGLGAELNAFPRGSFPFRLFYRRSLFDFSRDDADVATQILGAPDTVTTWVASSRVQKGFLRGLLLTVEHREIDFVDPGTENETYDRRVADWSRNAKRGKHRARVEQKVNAFATTGFDTNDLTLEFDERQSLGTDWRWDLNADGIRRVVEDARQSGIEVNDYRLQNRIQGRVRGRDSLRINLALTTLELGSAPAVDGRRASVAYGLHPGGAWQIGPFVQLDTRSQAEKSLRSPRVGLQLFWGRSGRSFRTHFNARSSVGRVREVSNTGVKQDRSQASGVTASLRHGGPRSLHRSLELEWASNEFSVRSTRVGGLPDLGLSGSNVGAQDLYRARLGLSRAFDSTSFKATAQWSRRSSLASALASGAESESWTGSVQYTRSSVSFGGSVGKTTVEQAALQRSQGIQNVSALVGWRPFRYLSLSTSYRKDRRNLELLPDIDTTYYEATARVRFGLIYFDTSIYERTEEMVDGGQRRNRTIRWNLTSRFGGWLPIVTGTKRRGVIR